MIRRLARRGRPRDGEWVAVDIPGWPTPRGELGGLPRAALREAIARWRREGLQDRWFFVRKPPGFRLRLRTDDSALGLAPQLYGWLQAAESAHQLRGFRSAIYEPEEFRFGGAHGMELAHAQFELDSEWALRRAAPDVDGALPRWLLSAMMLTDLFVQVVEDGAEVWDVWRRLEARVGADADARLDPREQAALCYEPARLDELPSALRELLDDVREGNAAIASALRAATLAGRLTIGPRAWLASVALFHGNRHGLARDELRVMIGALAAAFDPGDAR